METARDKLRAFGLALAVHAACVLIMLIGLWWTTETRPVSMPGPVIQVDLVGPTAAPKSVSVASVKPPKPNLPKPEPPKPDIPKPEPPKVAPTPEAPSPTEVERQDAIERERIAALAQEKAEQEKKEQEERHHQEQVELEEKKREQEEARQKALADVRKQREANDKALKLAQQKMQQIEDRAQREKAQQPAPPADHPAERPQTGAGGQDDDLAARYAAAIQSAVTNNWNRPDSASPGLRCSLNIVQIPGGDVISVTVASPCNADPVTRTSIEQAVMKAAPLPYQGYEKVFSRQIRFNFRYDG